MTSVPTSPEPGALALELFERHRRALRSYLRLATGSADIAEELSQDVYLRVVKSAEAYEPRGRDRAWLFSIARRLVIDHFRSRPPVPMPLAEISRPAAQIVALSVKEAIARLPERERETFLLCEVGGLSYSEISSATRLTVPAVRSAIYRARMQLRAEVITPPALAASGLVSGDSDHE
jgi:RNA polymerase sigma-70 factor, ECF subfamily